MQPVARTRFDSLEAREETVKEINSFYDKARTALAPSASSVGDRRPTSDRRSLTSSSGGQPIRMLGWGLGRRVLRVVPNGPWDCTNGARLFR